MHDRIRAHCGFVHPQRGDAADERSKVATPDAVLRETEAEDKPGPSALGMGRKGQAADTLSTTTGVQERELVRGEPRTTDMRKA